MEEIYDQKKKSEEVLVEAQGVLRDVLENFKKHEKEESLFLRPLPVVNEEHLQPELEKQMAVVRVVASELLNARQEAKIKLRWPLRTLHVETKSHEIGEAVTRLSRILERMGNVKGVQVAATPPDGKKLVRKEFEGGALYISTEMDEELYEEGVVNEVKRRVQMLRKAAGLVEKDTIVVYIGTEKELEGILERQKATWLGGVNAKELKLEAPNDAEEFEIDGRNVRIAVKKKEKQKD
jgi:valyl-tRNA synthetase